MGFGPPPGIAAHTGLTDKEVAGVIDHADASVSDGKLASGVGLDDGKIAKLPTATEGKVLIRGASAWEAGDVPAGEVTSNAVLEAIQKSKGVFWFNNNWLPVEMIKRGGDVGSSTGWDTYFVRMITAAEAGNSSWIEKYAMGLAGGYAWGKKRYLGMFVNFPAISAQYVHLVTGRVADAPLAPNIKHHIGFKLIDNELYGTVGNGTAESTLLLETLTATDQYRRLECILDPTIPECRFYVNGVDKGAVTTNLPAGTTDAFIMLRCVTRTAEDAGKSAYIFEWRVFQEE